jgi:hypothetical protein
MPNDGIYDHRGRLPANCDQLATYVLFVYRESATNLPLGCGEFTTAFPRTTTTKVSLVFYFRLQTAASNFPHNLGGARFEKEKE